MNKRGNFVDIPEYMVFAISFGFIVVFGFTVLNSFNTNIQATNETIIPAEAKVGMAQLTEVVPTYYDVVFAIFYLIFLIFSVVASRLIPSSPKFVFVMIFFFILLPIVSMMIENIWDALGQQTLLKETISNMPITNFMLDNLTFLILFYITAVGISLYTKEETT